MAKPNANAPLGQGGRFAALAAKVGPAIAAKVGMQKYGKTKMQSMAKKGRASAKGR